MLCFVGQLLISITQLSGCVTSLSQSKDWERDMNLLPLETKPSGEKKPKKKQTKNLPLRVSFRSFQFKYDVRSKSFEKHFLHSCGQITREETYNSLTHNKTSTLQSLSHSRLHGIQLCLYSTRTLPSVWRSWEYPWYSWTLLMNSVLRKTWLSLSSRQ